MQDARFKFRAGRNILKTRTRY